MCTHAQQSQLSSPWWGRVEEVRGQNHGIWAYSVTKAWLWVFKDKMHGYFKKPFDQVPLVKMPSVCFQMVLECAAITLTGPFR